MPDHADAPTLPIELVDALDALDAVASLMTCVDSNRWDTLARPDAKALGALLHQLHSDIKSSIAELVDR